MTLTSSDVGKFFRTRGGWRAKIIHFKSNGPDNDKGGPFEFLVVHKPGESDEALPVWQDRNGNVLDKWKMDGTKTPNFGMHVADLVEEIKD